MCDPVSIGLMVAGTALSMYGQTKVAGAQKRDIAKAGQDYQAERTRQQGFQQENAGTVADTLKTASPDSAAGRMADATTRRQDLYTAPISAKNFVADTPANFDPNNIVASRNAATGAMEKMKDTNLALAKGKLDAYGDAQQLGNILSANNAAKIGTTNRIADMSQKAEAQNQAVLPAKLTADQGAGATYAALGDTLKLGAMLYGVGGFAGGGPSAGQSFLARAGAPSWLSGGYGYSAVPGVANSGVYTHALAPIGG